jgi:ABC-2 type transport system ATP-binding protein
MSDLTENNYKKFKIEMKEDIRREYFELDGINNLVLEGRRVSFLFKGNINLILQKLAYVEVANIWIEEPSLEEVFIHYYEKEA